MGQTDRWGQDVMQPMGRPHNKISIEYFAVAIPLRE